MRFSRANSKLDGLAGAHRYVYKVFKPGKLYSFDLPAGRSCPGALECKSQVVKIGRKYKIKDGPSCRFRCYSASQEVIFPRTRKLRARNMECVQRLRTPKRIFEELDSNLPADCLVLRLFSSGDFFRESLFEAILQLAQHRSNIFIYGYTKNIPLWVKYKNDVASLDNFTLVASMGGKWDRLAKRHGFRTCTVCLSEEEAAEKGLEIDHDDTYAAGLRGDVNFATLLHGPQPAGSEASYARVKLMKNGWSGYNRGGPYFKKKD